MKIKDAQAPSLKPQASSLKPQASLLTPLSILEEYGLPVRTLGLLESELDCVYLRDLQHVTAEQVLAAADCGPKTLAEIRAALDALLADWERRQRFEPGGPMPRRNIFAELPATVYTDGKRTLFVSDGPTRGRRWATYRRKRRGSIRRVRSPALPERTSRARAQVDLDAWAASRGYRRLEA